MRRPLRPVARTVRIACGRSAAKTTRVPSSVDPMSVGPARARSGGARSVGTDATRTAARRLERLTRTLAADAEPAMQEAHASYDETTSAAIRISRLATTVAGSPRNPRPSRRRLGPTTPACADLPRTGTSARAGAYALECRPVVGARQGLQRMGSLAARKVFRS